MKYIKTLLISCFLFVVIGCGNKEEDITEIDNPELVTVAFFDALYNQKDIEKAASVCSPQMARIILHYRSPNAVARHLFNMSYDSVEITPDSTGVKVREQFKERATITVYFKGKYQDGIFKNVKRVSLIQKDKKWVINKILKDPF
ncbi:hypothetical protein AAD001_17320 [Colwelliaceae bacterium 6471]